MYKKIEVIIDGKSKVSQLFKIFVGFVYVLSFGQVKIFYNIY